MKKSSFVFILINLQLLTFILSCIFLKYFDFDTFGAANKWKFIEPSIATVVFIIYTIFFCYLFFLLSSIRITRYKKSKINFHVKFKPFIIILCLAVYLLFVTFFGHSFRSTSNMFGKIIITPLQTFITVYLLLVVFTIDGRKLYKSILIFAFSLGASGVGHLSVCLGLFLLNIYSGVRSFYKFIFLGIVIVLFIPLVIYYLLYIKYVGTFTANLDTLNFLLGWIFQRLNVQSGLAVYLIENSYNGVRFLNGGEIQFKALIGNFCKVFGCAAETDFKSVNQYAFSIFYSESLTEDSPGASPLTFGSSILLVNFWIGPLVTALLINILSFVMSGWYIFFERHEYVRMVIFYTFILKFMFFSPIIIVNFIDPYFVRVFIFAAAPLILANIKRHSKRKHGS